MLFNFASAHHEIKLKCNDPAASPQGLTEAFICGGLPPLVNGPDGVYARTYGM